MKALTVFWYSLALSIDFGKLCSTINSTFCTHRFWFVTKSTWSWLISQSNIWNHVEQYYQSGTRKPNGPGRKTGYSAKFWLRTRKNDQRKKVEPKFDCDRKLLLLLLWVESQLANVDLFLIDSKGEEEEVEQKLSFSLPTDLGYWLRKWYQKQIHNKLTNQNVIKTNFRKKQKPIQLRHTHTHKNVVYSVRRGFGSNGSEQSTADQSIKSKAVCLLSHVVSQQNSFLMKSWFQKSKVSNQFWSISFLWTKTLFFSSSSSSSFSPGFCWAK